MPLSRIAEIMRTAAGTAEPVFRPFPEDRKRIDIGSFASSWSRLHRALGWQPSVGFAEGIRRSLDYYRSELPHYLTPEDVEPSCALEVHAVAVS
jgi:nucleoside-diphosphate-sugar epimerase